MKSGHKHKEDLTKEHRPEIIQKRLSLGPKRQNVSDAVLVSKEDLVEKVMEMVR